MTFTSRYSHTKSPGEHRINLHLIQYSWMLCVLWLHVQFHLPFLPHAAEVVPKYGVLRFPSNLKVAFPNLSAKQTLCLAQCPNVPFLGNHLLFPKLAFYLMFHGNLQILTSKQLIDLHKFALSTNIEVTCLSTWESAVLATTSDLINFLKH